MAHALSSPLPTQSMVQSSSRPIRKESSAFPPPIFHISFFSFSLYLPGLAQRLLRTLPSIRRLSSLSSSFNQPRSGHVILPLPISLDWSHEPHMTTACYCPHFPLFFLRHLNILGPPFHYFSVAMASSSSPSFVAHKRPKPLILLPLKY